MSYSEIFILGWDLNALMFVINLILAFKIVGTKDRESLLKQSEELKVLKEEFDKYYPNRRYETLLTYMIPFTAFFRMSYRLIEMTLFFNKNSGTSMYDYMSYKYQSEINLAKERSKSN